MHTYKQDYADWVSQLTPLEAEVLKQLVITQEGSQGRFRDNPTKERQLTRLIGLLRAGTPTDEQWGSVFEVIVNLPEDDMYFIIDGVLGELFNEATISHGLSQASEESRQAIIESIRHQSKVSTIGKVWSTENMHLVGTAALKHSTANDKP